MDASPGRSARKARAATLLSFLLCGVAVSTWAPMVPLAKQRTGINEAELGLILLCMGAGAIVTMPFVGPVIQKSGSRRVIVISSLIACCTLPLLIVVNTGIQLAIALFIFGASVGALDVSMNSQAVVVQNKLQKTVMSSFHGMFSVGGLIGALLFGSLISLGLSPVQASLGIAVLLIFCVTIYARHFLDHPIMEKRSSHVFALPKGPVVMLGIFCFIVFLAEGALLDWSALFLKENRGYPVSLAGAGYAVFSISMAVMRFSGDRLVHSFGSRKIVFIGATVAAIGLLLAVIPVWMPASMAGFLLVGVGAANIVPVLFSAAGSADPSSPEISLAAVTTMGYAGQLAGPALIGFIAHASTLPIALGMLAAPLLLVALTFGEKLQGSSAGA